VNRETVAAFLDARRLYRLGPGTGEERHRGAGRASGEVRGRLTAPTTSPSNPDLPCSAAIRLPGTGHLIDRTRSPGRAGPRPGAGPRLRLHPARDPPLCSRCSLSSTTSGPRVAWGCGAGARRTTSSSCARRPTGPRRSTDAAGGRSCSPGSRQQDGTRGDRPSGLPRPARPSRPAGLADRGARPIVRLVGCHDRRLLPRRPGAAGDPGLGARAGLRNGPGHTQADGPRADPASEQGDRIGPPTECVARPALVTSGTHPDTGRCPARPRSPPGRAPLPDPRS
jgi:hypothetical protein